MDDTQVALIAAVLTGGPLELLDDEDGLGQRHYDRVLEWAGDFCSMLRHLRYLEEQEEP